MDHQRGFTLIETLLSLSICLLIVFNVTSIIQLVNVKYKNYNEDLAIGAKEVADYLSTANEVNIDDNLTYKDIKGKQHFIKYDNNRLVKVPGYEIIIDNIEDASIDKEGDYLYLKIIRGRKSYNYLVGDLYEKKNNKE